MSLILANLAAVIPMSAATKDMVIAYINAGATVASIVALLGGGAVITLIVKKAFKKGATKVIVAA